MSATIEQPKEEEVITRNQTKRPHFAVWSSLHNKRTVIQQKGGIVIVGTFVGLRDGFFVLENAMVTGRAVKALPPRILVERMSVAHMHEECEVERVENESQAKT